MWALMIKIGIEWDTNGDIQHYSTLFNIIQHYSTLFNIIQHYSTLFNIIQHYSTMKPSKKMAQHGHSAWSLRAQHQDDGGTQRERPEAVCGLCIVAAKLVGGWRVWAVLELLEKEAGRCLLTPSNRRWPRWLENMGMDQYLLIPFLGGWTSIYQLFWCSPGVQGFDTLPYLQK